MTLPGAARRLRAGHPIELLRLVGRTTEGHNGPTVRLSSECLIAPWNYFVIVRKEIVELDEQIFVVCFENVPGIN
jgi:hypothetical protein